MEKKASGVGRTLDLKWIRDDKLGSPKRSPTFFSPMSK